MKRLAVGITLVVLLVAVGVGLWVGEAPADSTAREVTPAVESSQESQESAVEVNPSAELERKEQNVVAEAATPAPPEEDVRSDRAEVAPRSVLTGRVVNTGGEPIANAVVSWSPLPADLSVRERFAENLRRAAKERSLVLSTAADGEFAFDEAIEGVDDEGSVIWVTHGSFSPGLRLVPQDVEGRLPEGDIVLEAAPTVRALVVDAQGAPVPDALVVQHGRSMPFRGEAWAEDWEERLSWLLLRESRTDESGTVPLQVFPGDQAIHAERDGKTSPSFLGIPERDVQLRLADSILVRLAVNYANGRPDLASPRVVFQAEIGHRVLTLADVVVDEVGEEPIAIPFVEADRYTARLHSRLLVPEVHRFRPERPGEEHFLEFEGARGSSLWFFAENEEGEPLVDAWGEFLWQQDGEWIQETIRATPPYPGYIHFSACPEGTIHVTVGCDGYVPRTHAPIPFPAPTEGTYVLQLQRGATLRGRCLAEGEPVRDFVVVVWPEGSEDKFNFETFRDREDGSFEMRGVLPGPSLVYAASAGVGTSETVPVDTSVDSLEGVTLDIETGYRGHGQVVDAETGTPVSGASVQAYVFQGNIGAGLMGAPTISNARGEFEVEGLSPRGGTLDITAPGYSAFTLEVPGSEQRERDLGVVRLHRTRDLIVRVVMPEEMAPSALDLAVSGPGLSDRPALGPDGTVVYEEATHGRYRFTTRLDGRTNLSHEFSFGADTENEVVIDLSGEASVHVSLLPGGTPESSDGLVLEVHASPVRTELNWREAFGSSGQASVRGVPPGIYSVAVRESFDDSSEIYAMKLVELEQGQELALEFRLGEMDRHFRLVDGAGDPVVGALVHASPPGTKKWLGNDMLSDGRGEFVIPSYEFETVTLSLSHPTAGHSLGVEHRVPDEDEVREIVLDGRASATIVLRDANGPLQGMAPRLWDPEEHFGIRAGVTDAEGRITWENLTDGVYRFVLIEDGYWYTVRHLEVFEGCEPLDVLAARRCDLTVLASTNGLPRSDVQLEFAWRTQEIPFSQLIEWGLLKADRMDLTTGPDGHLTVWGVPEGEFLWTATTNAGTTEGVLSISPEDQGVKVLEVR